MPKIIVDAEKKMLDAGKKLLLDGGYHNLSMRNVAHAGGTALGTAYNYFPSKDAFAMRILLKEWYDAEDALEKRLCRTQDPEEQAKILYSGVKKYFDQYLRALIELVGHSRNGNSLNPIYEAFVQKVCEISALPWDVVEIILHFSALQNKKYEDVEPSIKKLLK